MTVQVDYFLNGSGNGGVAQRLIANGMDYRALRPFVAEDGNSYIMKAVSYNADGTPNLRPVRVANIGTLRRDDWLRIDQAVVRVAKPVLRAVGDLRAAGLEVTVDGMAIPIYAYEAMSDITRAAISMDGLRQSERDRPEFQLFGLPLPIIHKDLAFSARQLAIAERGFRPSPIDTTSIEQAARRVAEEAEMLLTGSGGYAFNYGGYNVYGYTNWPGRITKTLTNPTSAGWTPNVLLDELLDMRQSLIEKLRPGPYMLYHSSLWDAFLDKPFSAAYPAGTLRQMLLGTSRISGIQFLDYLTGYQMILVQMTSDIIREVIGMDIKTVQWTEDGGMSVNFKVMCIMVPQIRTDFNLMPGISHGNAP